MPDPATTYHVGGGAATITLNRPANRNALSIELVESLEADLAAAEKDPAVRVIVLTNSGTTFCAGADLKAPPGRQGSSRDFAALLERILDSPKPVVGRIDGHCRGGGIGLAAACDISIAVEHAIFAFSEVRLGVAPAVISVVCLPKMRRGDALDLFLSGERISAARAVEVGLVTRVAPPGGLDAATADVVGALVRGGPQALALCKELIRAVPQLGRTEAFEWTAARSAEVFASEEAQAGRDAFLSGSAPPWAP